jgi:ribonuclease Z
MSESFAPRLVNPPFGDPVLYVGLRHRGRALLFDLGEIDRLAPRELLRVTRVCVSHTHVDHFIGFDRLLRVRLAHDRPLDLCGPPGILANVSGKLAGYTWNHAAAYPLSLAVHEIGPECVRSVRLAARSGFRPEALGEREFDGVVCADDDYAIRAVHLDHGVPCLGFALEASRSLNVRPERLAELGLRPGPWLDGLKAAIRAGLPGDTRLPVGLAEPSAEIGTERLERLRSQLILERRGEKLAYVVDVRFHRDNAERIVQLARGADVFFCEAPFLDADRERARQRDHLTARQAGSLARAAGVTRLVPFHHSPRYGDDPHPLQEEAQRTFRGELAPDEPV